MSLFDFSKFCLCALLLAVLQLLPNASDAALVQLLPPSKLSQLERGVKILDARPGAAWLKGHIPGAMSFDWREYTETDLQGIAYRKLPNEVIAQRLGGLGINQTSSLVIYGDADSSWGGEGWACWLFGGLGHLGDIYLLEGGVQAWQRQGGLLTERIAPTPATVRYQSAERTGLDINTEDLRQQPDLQLVDTRSFFEWLRGSIPGAVRINWSHFFTGAERRPIDRSELINLLREHGLEPEKPVVYYCSGGIRSGYAWMVHELAGMPTAKNYEGGMEAWRKLR